MMSPGPPRISPWKILGFLGLAIGITALLAFGPRFFKKPVASPPSVQTLPTQIPQVATSEPKCEEPTYRLNGWEHEGYLDDNPVMTPYQGTPNWFTVELVCDGQTLTNQQGSLEILETPGGMLFEEVMESGKTFEVRPGNTPEFPGLFGFRFQLLPGFHDFVLRFNGSDWPIKFQTRSNVLDWGSVVASDQAPSTTSEVKQILLNNQRAKYALEKIAGITDTSKCRITQRQNTEPFAMLWMDANLNIGVQEIVPAGKWVWLPVCQVEENNQVVEKTVAINPDCFNPQAFPPGKGPGGPVVTPVPGRVVTPTIGITIYSSSPTPVSVTPVPTELPLVPTVPVWVITPEATSTPPPVPTVGPTVAPPPTSTPGVVVIQFVPTATLMPVISPTPMPATPTFHFQLATIPPPTVTPGPSRTPCCPSPQFSPAPSFTPGPPPTRIWTPEPTPTRPPLPPTPPPTTPTMVPTAVQPTLTPAPNATAGPKPTGTSFALRESREDLVRESLVGISFSEMLAYSYQPLFCT